MKSKSIYRCTNCGYETVKWMGKCPNCNEWNSLEENFVETKKRPNGNSLSGKKKTVKKLAEVTSSNSDRIITSINEFNRVMGGGIVKDSVTIITAKPGAGKSTLLLQVADDVSSKGHKVIYASGEESDSQIKSRADRILNKIN
ncbi:MAG: AAA family ATPase, partial [Sedimentibacter sp.]